MLEDSYVIPGFSGKTGAMPCFVTTETGVICNLFDRIFSLECSPVSVV